MVVPLEDSDHIRRGLPRAGKQAEHKVQSARQKEGDHAGLQHPPDVAVDVGAGDRTDQLGAGGHRGAAVPEEGTGQNCAAGIDRRDAHHVGNAHADYPHRCCRPEGGAGEKRNQAAEPETDHNHQIGPHHTGRRADDGGDGAAGAPYGRQHPDEHKGNQDVFYRPDAGKRCRQQTGGPLPPGKPVGKEDEISEEDGKQNRQSGDQAEQQSRHEDQQHRGLKHGNAHPFPCCLVPSASAGGGFAGCVSNRAAKKRRRAQDPAAAPFVQR